MLLRAGQRDVEQPPMFLPLAPGERLGVLAQRLDHLGLARAQHRHRFGASSIAQSSRRSGLRSGSAVASARMTSGASSPFDPWTVITRTASSGAEGSRVISTSPRSNQSRKRWSVAVAVPSNWSAAPSSSSIGSRASSPSRRSSLRRPSSGPVSRCSRKR
ncbi:hypothetical protein ACFSTI_08395 [Rhizorhabdus histidinilytica]